MVVYFIPGLTGLNLTKNARTPNSVWGKIENNIWWRCFIFTNAANSCGWCRCVWSRENWRVTERSVTANTGVPRKWGNCIFMQTLSICLRVFSCWEIDHGSEGIDHTFVTRFRMCCHSTTMSCEKASHRIVHVQRHHVSDKHGKLIPTDKSFVLAPSKLLQSHLPVGTLPCGY